MSVTVIQQAISAGGNFTGVAPPGARTVDKDIIRYAAAATGGLFDFGLTGPAVVRSVEIKLSNQSGWSLSKVDTDGDEIVLWSGTTGTAFRTIASDEMWIFEGQKLKLTTTGATGAMKARIAVDLNP